MSTSANFYNEAPDYQSKLVMETGKTGVGMTGVKYDFFIYPTNDVPRYARIWITLPLTMPIDATLTGVYTIVSQEGST
jgi:hypothetical protein